MLSQSLTLQHVLKAIVRSRRHGHGMVVPGLRSAAAGQWLDCWWRHRARWLGSWPLLPQGDHPARGTSTCALGSVSPATSAGC